MGTELARDMIKQGWNVGCLDINEAAGRPLAEELGEDAIFVKCDVASYDEQARAFTEIWNKWGRLDALLLNAGIADRSSHYILTHRESKEIPPAPDCSATMVDFFGVVYGTRLATHFMRQNSIPGGQIIATASVVALHPHSSFPEMSAAKAAVKQICSSTRIFMADNTGLTILPFYGTCSSVGKSKSLSHHGFVLSAPPATIHEKVTNVEHPALKRALPHLHVGLVVPEGCRTSTANRQGPCTLIVPCCAIINTAVEDAQGGKPHSPFVHQ